MQVQLLRTLKYARAPFLRSGRPLFDVLQCLDLDHRADIHKVNAAVEMRNRIHSLLEILLIIIYRYCRGQITYSGCIELMLPRIAVSLERSVNLWPAFARTLHDRHAHCRSVCRLFYLHLPNFLNQISLFL